MSAWGKKWESDTEPPKACFLCQIRIKHDCLYEEDDD